MPRLSLPTLLARLDGLARDDITSTRVQDLLADGELDEAALLPFVGTRPDKYARRLVRRDQRFEVLVLTWAKGQATPVHNHAGNHGWVRLVRGQIREQTFRLVPGSAVPDAELAASVPGRVGNVGLECTGDAVVATIGAVATVDRVRAIHSLGNPAADVAVTLHVYSLPHDACLAFDVERRTCERRQLALDPLPSLAASH